MGGENEGPRVDPLDFFRMQPQHGPRPAFAGGKRPAVTATCRAPAGHRQGPVGLGPAGNFYYRFYITFRKCKPVFYEYKGEKNSAGIYDFTRDLTWPQKNRNYYQVGDVILFHKIYQTEIPKTYPTLARKTNQKTLVENILDSEILGLSPDYKAGQVVVSIKPSIGKPGYGIVETKPILFFGQTGVFLADERERTYDVRLLTNCRVTGKLSVTLTSIIPFLVFTSEVMMMVLGGAVKAAASRAVGVFIVRKGAIKAVTHVAKKQAAKALLKSLATKTATATYKASQAFGIEYIKAMGAGQEQAFRAAAGQKVDYKAPENAIRAGAKAFAFTFVSECLGSTIGAIAEQQKIKAAQEYIAKKIVALVTTDTTSALEKAYRKGVLDRERQKTGAKQPAGVNLKTAKTQRGIDMGNEMQGFLGNYAKGLLKDVTGILF